MIQSTGSAFEQVEYVDIDGKPGLEIVVGRQVSDQLQRTLSVFSFAEGEARQLLSAGYNKYLSCDLNSDGMQDLMLLRSGETETDMGHAVLYSFSDDALQRSREAELSRQGYSIKRITSGKLHGGEEAVFVASSVEESAILTDVFTLKDTYGFPLDLTQLILSENGFTTNEEEYNKALEHQKEMGRQANKQELGDWVELCEGDTEFVGYDILSCETKVLRYRKVNQKGKDFYQVVLSQTPFYAEMGGEVGDTGTLGNVRVLDTKKENNLPVHLLAELPENIEGTLLATVDTERRQAIACNHSATHIIHYALRQVLGEHVEQKGSFVNADSLRFDFSHFQKVTPEQLREAEILANKLIRQDLSLEESRHTPIEEAKAMGAMALFGEKYGDDVRVIKFGPSVELCGGCHVASTGKIGALRIVMESSVAAGIRRIEAVTAAKADELYYKQVDTLGGLRAMLNNAPDLAGAIRKAIEDGTFAEFRQKFSAAK